MTYITDRAEPPTHAELGLMVGAPPPMDKRVTHETGVWTPPYNRWQNQHMRGVFPTIGWPASDDPVELPARIDPKVARVPVSLKDGSMMAVEDFFRATYTDGLVVAHRGAIVHEQYHNGMTPARPFQVMSCGKSFVGLHALDAIREGLFAGTDRVGDLIEELDVPGGAFGDATVGDLLDMTNSMDFNEDYNDPNAHIHDYAYACGLGPGTERTVSIRDRYEFLVTLRMVPGQPHGDVFQYGGPKTDALNWVTTRQTGSSLTADMSEFWQDLGAAHEGYMWYDLRGLEVAAGGVNASPHDLIRYALMIVNGGEIGGRQLFDSSVIDLLRAGGSREAFSAGTEAMGFLADGDWSFRAQWWIRHTPGREAVISLGTSGQWIYCDTARDLAVVRVASCPEPLNLDHDEEVLRAIDAIADALS